MAIRWWCVVLGVLLPGLAWAESPKATVEVRGQGEVMASADRVVVRLAVLTSGSDVRQVKTRNDELCRQIAEVVQTQRLPRPTLQKTNLTVGAREEWSVQVYTELPQQSPPQPQQQSPYRQLSGKEKESFREETVSPTRMTRDLEVSCRDMTQAVDLLAEIVPWEATQKSREVRVAPVVCELTDRKPVLAEARRRAVADAREKASLLVEATGQKLGRPQQIIEEPTAGGISPYPTTPGDPFAGVDGLPGGPESTCPLRLVGLRGAESSEGVDFERLPPAQVAVSVSVKVIFEVE